MDTTTCPKCGTENPAAATNCRNCHLNLRFAAEHPEEIARANLEAARREAFVEQSVPAPRGIGERLGLGALSLLAGAAGIVLLFIIGEGTSSGILGYAIMSFVFAFLAYALAKSDPPAWWAYALLLCVPVTLLSLGSAEGGYLFLALLMFVIAMVGGYFGASAGRGSPEPPEPPPSP